MRDAHEWTSADASARTALCILLVVAVVLIAHFRGPNIETQIHSKLSLIVVTIVAGLLSFLIDKLGNVNAATSTALIGMCFAGTLKFVVNNVMDTDWKANPRRSLKHGLGAIASEKFIRYTLTVLLNIFVSMVLFKPLYLFMKDFPYLRHKHALISGVATTVTIGLVSFAYSDTLRYKWIDRSASDDHWIHNGTMQVIISVAAAVFLASDTQIFANEPGINQPTVKLGFVIGTMCMLCMLAKCRTKNTDIEETVTSTRSLTKGDKVHGVHLHAVDGRQLGDDVFRVTRAVHRFDHTEYNVVRETPQECDFSGRATYGSMVFVLIGALTSSVTIFGTAKTTRHRLKTFLGFMVIAFLIASPGLVA